MGGSWNGHYLDGLTADRQPVTVSLTPREIHITKGDGVVLRWPYSEIVESQGAYRGEQVRIERGGDSHEALVLTDQSFLTAMLRMDVSSGKFGKAPSRVKRLYLIIISIVGAVTFLLLLHLYGVPLIAGILAEGVPLRWEEKLGEMVMNQLVADGTRCDGPMTREAVDEIVTRLNSAAPYHPYTFRVTVVESETVNALAAPGGYILLFTGLLRETESPEELAGVVAHEMVHIMEQHPTKGIFRNLSTSLLISIIGGDMGSIGRIAADGASTLTNLRYSREYEEEADRRGMELVIDAGIDPSGMAQFFERLERQEGSAPGLLRYLSTHPPTGDRISHLQGEAESFAAPSKEPLLSSISWKQVITECGVRP
ncbi:MAG: M48 family metallopeptidase [Thermodesulfobacteriota bacterium]